MYRFHFNVMRPLFPARIEVLFSDTDSLCYFIKEGDLTDKLSSIAQLLDFSNYNSNHPLFSLRNKCVPGK